MVQPSDDQSDWARFLSAIRERCGDAAFRTWFDGMRLESREDGEATIRVRSKFVADEIEKRYPTTLSEAWRTSVGAAERVCIRVGAGCGGEVVALEDRLPALRRSADERAPVFDAARDPLAEVEQPANPASRFEAFVVDRENRMAHAAAKAGAAGDAMGGAIYIFGPSGCGKTHLLHAAALARRDERPSDRVLIISADALVTAMMAAYQDKSMLSLKRRLRDADMLIVDDIHFLRGREKSQEEMLNVVDALLAQGKTVMASGDVQPKSLARAGLNPRLASRLDGGLSVGVDMPGPDLRYAILKSKHDDAVRKWRFRPVADDILKAVATRMRVSARELDGALRVLLLHQKEFGGDMTVETTERVLSAHLAVGPGPVSLRDIKDAVSETFEVSIPEIDGKRRTQRVVRARHATTYLAKLLTQESYLQIGAAIGGRDHSTIISSMRRAEALVAKDKAFAALVETVRDRLGAR